LSNTTAVGIAEAIVTFIQKCDLRIENIRGMLLILIREVYQLCPFPGQGYDGANVVAGKSGGVRKLIKDISPRAIYVHCSNHSLDLVLAEVCSLQVIKAFFGVVKADIDFATPLIIITRVFCITKSYAEQLQKPTCDLVKCYQSIEQVSIYLAELVYDDTQLNELYNEFNEFVKLNEIDVHLLRTTSRQYQTVKNIY
jgi:hypothetical protein